MCGICGFDCHVSLETFDGGLYCSKGLIHVFFFFWFFFSTWAEICVPRTYLSRVRTEVGLVPMLIVFKLSKCVCATSALMVFLTIS